MNHNYYKTVLYFPLLVWTELILRAPESALWAQGNGSADGPAKHRTELILGAPEPALRDLQSGSAVVKILSALSGEA